ncbi:hypothetical protein [Chromobacterium alticapitis]|uniref:hypothetical protein n=1 Tax=Chromobacterium alticapitis TaxID=2073169 RepID=UPI0011AFDD5F|nr:hypothetical protein [Chromobacterium alticapitis]
MSSKALTTIINYIEQTYNIGTADILSIIDSDTIDEDTFKKIEDVVIIMPTITTSSLALALSTAGGEWTKKGWDLTKLGLNINTDRTTRIQDLCDEICKSSYNSGSSSVATTQNIITLVKLMSPSTRN